MDDPNPFGRRGRRPRDLRALRRAAGIAAGCLLAAAACGDSGHGSSTTPTTVPNTTTAPATATTAPATTTTLPPATTTTTVPATTTTVPATTTTAPTTTTTAATVTVRSSDGAEMVFVPGGEFPMGSTPEDVDDALVLCSEQYRYCNDWFYSREAPEHLVTVTGFHLDRHEVSNDRYRRCVEAGVCEAPAGCGDGDPFGHPDAADHPVVCVTWGEATAYCEWAGARLPTEAEWEYAAAGPGGHDYPWGDEFGAAVTNYCGADCPESHADPDSSDGFPQTAPVASLPGDVSWAGVLDLGGNAAEWVGDWLGDYAPGPVADPSGPAEGTKRVIRGGSWKSPAVYSRTALRAAVEPDTRLHHLGFRCAMPER